MKIVSLKNTCYATICLLAPIALLAQSGNWRDSCESAEWVAESKPFSTTTRPRGLRPSVDFHSQLNWEEKRVGNHVCALRRPSINIDGFRLNFNFTTWELHAVTANIEIELFDPDDVFYIDQSEVNPFNANIASFRWPPPRPPFGNGITTSMDVGGRTATFTWRSDKPQPTGVSIGDPEGDVIEIKHNSPIIVVTNVRNAAGAVVTVLGPLGETLAPITYPHVWTMSHRVEAD